MGREEEGWRQTGEISQGSRIGFKTFSKISIKGPSYKQNISHIFYGPGELPGEL